MIYVTDDWPENGIFYIAVYSSLTTDKPIIGYDKFQKHKNGTWSKPSTTYRGLRVKELYKDYMKIEEFLAIEKAVKKTRYSKFKSPQ